jgi:hypothetical protein
MKAKLIRTGSDYLLRDMGGEVLAITNGTTEGRKLSKQNCNEIFGVVDVEKLAKEEAIKISESEIRDEKLERIYKRGFNKAMELNKDKVFTIEDMMNCWNKALKFQDHKETLGEYIQSIQQPTEIEVEIEMHTVPESLLGWKNQEKLDSEGCLILKKI